MEKSSNILSYNSSENFSAEMEVTVDSSCEALFSQNLQKIEVQ
jgi:hypothetical protein